MKAVEKVKAQRAVDKIQSGNFDEGDVEMLFMRLRAYSGEHKIFRESADFVAHNDARNKGLTVSSLDNFYLSLRFFYEYVGDNVKQLDISKEFPSYVKKLLKYQAVNCDQDDFKSRLKMSSHKAISIIDNVFREDTTKKTCILKGGKISDSKLAVLNQLLSYIKIDAVFTPDQFMGDLYGVLKKNDIQYSEEKLEINRSKILLSFGLLLHMADFKLTGGAEATCLLGCQEAWQSDDTPIGEDRFGKLSIFGHCVISMGDRPVTVIYNVFDTGLQASDYCGELMFRPEQHSQLTDVSGTRLDLERPLQMIDGLLVPI